MQERPLLFERIAVMGVGLIGGSVALAAKKWGAARHVIGFGRNRDRLQAALGRGVIDEIASTPEELAKCELVVVCTPVDRIADDVLFALNATKETSAIVTDAGSVKGKILTAVDEVFENDRFIPAHPLAGSHQHGFEHASANLFLTRLCLLTPQPKQVSAPKTLLVKQFWEQIGMRVQTMSAEEHDRILALTSHLPHLAASVVASVVDPKLLSYAATGYRDTTRVAAGDPELWAAILSMNAPSVIEGIDQMIQSLSLYREHLANNRQQALVPLLQQGCENRRQYREDPSHPDDGT